MATAAELADEIASLAAHLDAATARLLCCIREFDEDGGWERQGAVSCAHWLSWRIGVDLPTAREKVRVARALGALPAIDRALGRGELSYAKVRALTRVATPENEARLLELAHHATGAQLEKICRAYRRVASSLMEEGPLVEDRSVQERLLPGGMVRLELVLHPDEAALVRQAIEKARTTLREQRRNNAHPTLPDQPGAREVPNAPAPPEASESAISSTSATSLARPRVSVDTAAVAGSVTPSAAPGCKKVNQVSEEAPVVSLADAAVHLAERYLSEPPGEGAASTRTGNGGDRYQVFVHLDQDMIGDDGDWVATLDDGTRLPAETLRRIACDCGLVATRTDDDGSVLDVGRRTRSIPPAIRRALWLRDRGCRFPGCGHTRFLHGHHVQHWMTGGETKLSNLVLLCTRHHRLLHEGKCSIEHVGDAEVVFHMADGKCLPGVPAALQVENAVEELRIWAAEHGVEIGPETNFPWWDGSVPDYDWIIGSLFSGVSDGATGKSLPARLPASPASTG